MGFLILLRAGIKRQKGSVIGVGILIFIITVSLVTALASFTNSRSYIAQEMKRLGYGNITAWVSDVEDLNALQNEINGISEVEKVEVQNIIYADYVIDGKQSDDQGQLIPYNREAYPYRLLVSDMSGYDDTIEIAENEVYISPAMHSSYQVQIGGEIRFVIARTGESRILKVKGYFEDPFMGSSMIDMKGFLVSEKTFMQLSEQIAAMPDYDAAAKNGAMIHIFQCADSTLSSSEWNRVISEQSSLGRYTDFVHSYESIYGFMLLLQNIFTGILIAFATVLSVISMIVMGHSITATIEQDDTDMGILKTVGYTNGSLKLLQLTQYAIGIAMGMVAGLLCSLFSIRLTSDFTVTSTGMLMPTNLPFGCCVIALANGCHCSCTVYSYQGSGDWKNQTNCCNQ